MASLHEIFAHCARTFVESQGQTRIDFTAQINYTNPLAQFGGLGMANHGGELSFYIDIFYRKHPNPLFQNGPLNQFETLAEGLQFVSPALPIRKMGVQFTREGFELYSPPVEQASMIIAQRQLRHFHEQENGLVRPWDASVAVMYEANGATVPHIKVRGDQIFEPLIDDIREQCGLSRYQLNIHRSQAEFFSTLFDGATPAEFDSEFHTVYLDQPLDGEVAQRIAPPDIQPVVLRDGSVQYPFRQGSTHIGNYFSYVDPQDNVSKELLVQAFRILEEQMLHDPTIDKLPSRGEYADRLEPLLQNARDELMQESDDDPRLLLELERTLRSYGSSDESAKDALHYIMHQDAFGFSGAYETCRKNLDARVNDEPLSIRYHTESLSSETFERGMIRTGQKDIKTHGGSIGYITIADSNHEIPKNGIMITRRPGGQQIRLVSSADNPTYLWGFQKLLLNKMGISAK